MTIRPYRPSDRPQLLAIHQRQSEHDGLPYLLNSPDDPRQFATVVAVEAGRIVASASARRVAEGSTVLDPLYGGRGRSGPVARWTLLSKMIRESARIAYDSGYTELFAATAPEWRGYGKRLVQEVGFVHDLRNHYFLDLAERYGQKEAVSGRTR